MIIESTENCKKDESFIINDYLRRKTPICREERQFALFLFNRLKENDREIIDYLDIPGKIVDVYFEVALMRDYWNSDKKSFNEKLKYYIDKKFYLESEESIIGSKETVHINVWEKSHPYGRWMMNAKPDIGIIVLLENEYYLHFIECKLKSEEGVYKCRGYKNKKQVEIQEYILDFLSQILKYETNTDGTKKFKDIKKGSVLKVRFSDKKSSNLPDRKGFIIINKTELIK